jgi:ubiquinone biosynthesis protein
MSTALTTVPQDAGLLGAARRFLQSADQSILMVGHFMGHIDSLVDDLSQDSQRIKLDAQELAQALMDRFHIARRGIQASPKALRVAKVILGIAIKYRLEMGRADSSSTRHQERMEKLHQSAAETLRELCIETRGTFLKLGQFLSMRPDLVPPAYVRELGTLRNQVPALPFELIAEELESSLGRPLEDLFEHIDEEPVAAASLAQVHRATGHDGRDFAVKVQVPGAAEQVAADIAILRAVAFALAETSLPFDAKSVLDQLAESVDEELHYDREAEHCQVLGRLLAEQAGLEIPEVIGELSSQTILTMSWMPGQTLDKALEGAPAEDRKQVLTTLVDAYCTQIFEHGYFQADPHAGNLLVQEDLSVVLLDFGCVQVLSDEVRIAYADVMKAMFMGDQDKLHEQLQILGFTSDCEDPQALEDLVSIMLDMLKREDALAEWARDPTAATQALIDATAQVPGLVTPRHFVLLGRVLATLGGMLIENADAGVSLPTILASSLMRAR